MSGRSQVFAAVMIALLLATCGRTGEKATAPAPSNESIRTGIDADACRREVDKTDPNETPYLECPGVVGYSLIVRRVEAGRQSVELVDPSGRNHALNYHEVVTRHMFGLSNTAEWRIATRDGARVPIALIVQVHARESDDPEKITRTFEAVAKVTPDEACVTDRPVAGTQSEPELRALADSAPTRPCAPAQPPMVQ